MSTAVRVDQLPPAETPEVTTPQWRLGTKIAFRFLFIYFVLFTADVPIQFVPIPLLQRIAGRYFAWLQITSSWVGENLLGMREAFSNFVPNPPGGSHDTAVAYVECVVYIGVAVVGTLLWSWLDRKRPNYERLYNWFSFYLRVNVGIMMINYGSVKVIPAQFPMPTLSRLLERYGNSSPMGLLWTSMGVAHSYSYFAGGVEVLGGLLMFIPSLATLGALISLGALSNVFMLNVGYDVPVKLGCMHWIAMALIIIAPDARRLMNFFILNRQAETAVVRPLFRRRSWQVAAVVLQIAFGVAFLGYRMIRSERIVEQTARDRLSAPLYGIWAVDEFAGDGQAAPATLAWHRMTIDSVSAGLIEAVNGPDRKVNVHFEPAGKLLKLTMEDDPKWTAEFTYDDSARPLLLLRGKIEGNPVHLKLHREDDSKFLLVNRPFRWITPATDNR